MRVPESNVVDVRPGEYPVACLSLLIQREHMNLVVKGQPPDQSQQRRDHAVFPRAVDASRYDQSNAHVLSPPVPAYRARDPSSSRSASTASSGWRPLRISNPSSFDTPSLKALHCGWLAA